nr:ABC transporter ATP-binding protein [uncultured Methanoregula sp.]
MNDKKIAIRVRNLGKKYTISGPQENYLTLRDAIVNSVKAPFKRFNGALPDKEFWALKEVSFDIEHGEVIGIIGRNGAGKSTLLKILSRITVPTEGIVELHGRVGSLLEVGTGFHPEMTGRENIFLNGSILGMKRREIEAKLDEIVKFSEIEKFLDTPVKRYSSGMYVRLAFAVAAHMEPEILVVDEVLAVGDLAFQKKCLGKMQDIATEGRTVFFVSHNMGAIQKLCSRTILLSQGQIIADGETSSVVQTYLTSGLSQQGERIWINLSTAPGNEIVRMKAVRALNHQKIIASEFSVREPVYLEIEFSALKGEVVLNVGFYLYDMAGTLLFTAGDMQVEEWQGKIRPKGEYRTRCVIPGDLLNEGQIRVMAYIVTEPHTVHVIEKDALAIQIVDNQECGGARGNYPKNWPGGAFRPLLKWTTEYIPVVSTDMR